MKLDPTTQRIMPEHQVTHFTLCRHGKVELGGHRRVYGKLELSLSSEGALQASALVDYVAQQPTYDGIIASDLQVQTNGRPHRRCPFSACPLDS